jgi:DNA-binding NarL/FixJ family response regulator
MTGNDKIIRVIVVDDHTLFRVGIRTAFEYGYPDICVTGEAESGDDLFAMLPTTPVDVVLLDVKLPGGIGGAEIAARLRRDYPDVKILAVSAENTSETIQAMIEAGIDGFISKQRSDGDELAAAIRAVMSGLEYFGRDISTIIFGVYVSKKKTAEPTHEFTEREKEIILACRDGLMGKEIADRLGISPYTVNVHKRNIFQKLGINNTMEMVQYALKKGIIRIEN